MRLNIGRKLWLAFFCTLTLCVLTMYLLMHNSLKRGFLDYTSQQAVQRLEILQDALVSIHREDGSFDELTSDPTRWLTLKSIIFSGDNPRMTAQSDPAESSRRRSPQEYYREFVSSVSLYDVDKTLLMGVVKPNQQLSWMPINNGDPQLGYIGFVKPTAVIRDVDRRFMAHQLRIFAVISLVILAISIGIATLLARRISRPISALSENTMALASGDYKRRVDVNSQDEIGQLCQGFNQLAQTLEANEHSRANWIADISHEMRTPVSVLKAQIEAMQDGVRPVNPKTLELLNEKISGLNGLIDNLFELTLSDIGALDYQKEDLSLAALTRSCVEHYQAAASAAGLTLKAIVPARDLVPIHGDPKRLEQLLTNLLQNAIRYTNTGGQIQVELVDGGENATLWVRDSAPAVAPEKHEKIFERLYRLETSRNRSTGGAGLGLAICKNIVAAHQGEIAAEASPLGGLAIRVTLPKTQ
ncbi:ATP-binding protein [Marinimicrobium sp. ABcell2]|uniref:ATP-binding protein n=1 Tax=Marinimicrobium sp. ABcell2 TaxID=3069751 RepID=UPI0027B5D217|nr:ATP-binding protein [Marinimicrobium sp. ABcell2]MDQ2077655.1 ATP-binding protein [Marinimicrobium sp. ABcell2]